jgi:hypothetical protein
MASTRRSLRSHWVNSILSSVTLSVVAWTMLVESNLMFAMLNFLSEEGFSTMERTFKLWEWNLALLFSSKKKRKIVMLQGNKKKPAIGWVQISKILFIIWYYLMNSS